MVNFDLDACLRAFRTRDPRFDGKIFCGVTTTRIYCRPICPARPPKREHMRFFRSAAAAQDAGFRPCLRCRPETAPEVAAWNGTSNTVKRALAILESGRLDRVSMPALAERVGVGERQLRRLFDEHLGASPIAVWQTRRVLLALQLLRETRLSMTDVALAAGFTSIRRFNEVFRDLFRRPPASLRTRGRGAIATPAAGTVTVLLRYRPPYDWAAMLAFFRARAIAGVEVVTDTRYARTFELDGPGSVVVEPGPGHALQATIQLTRVAALPAVIARLRRVFDLAADPHAIGAQLAEDTLLAPMIAARPGLRVPGAWDGFELAARAVLGQQITVKAAAVLAARLVRSYGEALPAGCHAADGLTHLFPGPERLRSADVRTLGMPLARARTLIALAAEVASNSKLFGAGEDPADCIARLRALSGVGEWTAQYIAMRELREPDAFPADDVALKRAIAGRHGQRPTSRELVARAECWRPWRAYAAQHLWTSLAQERT